MIPANGRCKLLQQFEFGRTFWRWNGNGDGRCQILLYEEARRLVRFCLFFLGLSNWSFCCVFDPIPVNIEWNFICEFYWKISTPGIRGFLFCRSYYLIRSLSFCSCLTLPLRKLKRKVRFISHPGLKCHVGVAKLLKTEEEIPVNNGLWSESENLSKSGKLME